MAIFGTTNCRLSGSFQVDLQYSDIDPTYFMPEEIVHRSVLTGHKTYSNKNDNCEFVINCNLFKYDVSASIVLSKLLNIKSEEFYFYPHTDEDPIYDVYGQPIKFHLKEIEPYYVTQDTRYDAVRLVITSTDYHKFITFVGGYGENYGSIYGIYGW